MAVRVRSGAGAAVRRAAAPAEGAAEEEAIVPPELEAKAKEVPELAALIRFLKSLRRLDKVLAKYDSLVFPSRRYDTVRGLPTGVELSACAEGGGGTTPFLHSGYTLDVVDYSKSEACVEVERNGKATLRVRLHGRGMGGKEGEMTYSVDLREASPWDIYFLAKLEAESGLMTALKKELQSMIAQSSGPEREALQKLLSTVERFVVVAEIMTEEAKERGEGKGPGEKG